VGASLEPGRLARWSSGSRSGGALAGDATAAPIEGGADRLGRALPDVAGSLRYNADMSTTDNPIANRVARIKAGDDPQSLGRLHSGYAILANQQPDAVRGCCMLLPDPTPAHLTDLDHAGRAQFLTDLALLGEAVREATGCARVNYLILCNQTPWLHGHVVPRYESEAPEKFRLDPFAAYDFPSARQADASGADRELHGRIRSALERLTTAGERRPWADLI